uniref:Uncharacterized protein n=1 Tax=Oryza meridionalis TaxID=40149 RepID=A0A0E0DYD4_9ORYZ
MVDDVVEVARRAMLFRMPRRRRSTSASASASAATATAGRMRRKKVAVVRLGGGGGGGGTKRRLFGALRRLRLRWLAAMYRRALRRLRVCYANAVRDLIDGAALAGALRAPVGIEYSHAAAFGPAATVGF